MTESDPINLRQPSELKSSDKCTAMLFPKRLMVVDDAVARTRRVSFVFAIDDVNAFARLQSILMYSTSKLVT